jgi:hypothetical protein
VVAAAWISQTEWAVPPSTWPSRPPPATRRLASPASGTVSGAYRHPPGRHGRRPQQGGQPCLPQVRYLGRTAIHLAVTAAGTVPGAYRHPPGRHGRVATGRTASPASGTVPGPYRHPPGRHSRRPQQGGQPRLPQVRYLERTAINLTVTAAALPCPPPAIRRTALPASCTVPGPFRHPSGRHGRRPQQGGQPRLPQVRYLGRTAIHLAVTDASRNKEDSLACLRYITWAVPPSTWPSQLPPATRRTASPALRYSTYLSLSHSQQREQILVLYLTYQGR